MSSHERCSAVQGLGRGRHARFGVGEAEGVGRDQLLVVNDADRDAGDPVDGRLILDPLLPGPDRVGDPRVGGEPARILGNGRSEEGNDDAQREERA